MTVVRSAGLLRDAISELRFGPPVSHVYNPLEYAWAPHEQYLLRHAKAPKRVVFLGMNPGPYGMAQTGVPFGEVSAVRDWIGIMAPVGKPAREHPRRPITGFACPRTEASGARLWGLFAARFGTAQNFFRDHFVANYCPLVFMLESGANLTPDKLPARRQAALFAACDAHLKAIITELKPEWVVGVGNFAAERARTALAGMPVRFARILHPSPASPAANRNWSGVATEQLQTAGIWAAAAAPAPPPDPATDPQLSRPRGSTVADRAADRGRRPGKR